MIYRSPEEEKLLSIAQRALGASSYAADHIDRAVGLIQDGKEVSEVEDPLSDAEEAIRGDLARLQGELAGVEADMILRGLPTRTGS